MGAGAAKLPQLGDVAMNGVCFCVQYHCCPVNIRQAPLFSKKGLGEI